VVESYTADKTAKTAPVPLTPTEADRVLLSKDYLVAFPAYADTVNPPPTLQAYDTRRWSDGVAGRFVLFPAQRTFIGVIRWVA
jgi:hypothetical protein